jgi:hypothetical protein
MEVSGDGSVQIIYGSGCGSRRPKSIRIRNTACCVSCEIIVETFHDILTVLGTDRGKSTRAAAEFYSEPPLPPPDHPPLPAHLAHPVHQGCQGGRKYQIFGGYYSVPPLPPPDHSPLPAHLAQPVHQGCQGGRQYQIFRGYYSEPPLPPPDHSPLPAHLAQPVHQGCQGGRKYQIYGGVLLKGHSIYVGKICGLYKAVGDVNRRTEIRHKA